MIITENTRISEIIKHDSRTIDVIASINKHFKKLKNPVLRKVLAARVSIADAARIGGVPVCVLIDNLKKIGFEINDDCACGGVNDENKNKTTTEKKVMKKENIIEMDVRPVLEGGDDPFEAIMAQLKTMKPGHTLKIINTFEPIPLLNILKKKGYNYLTERPEPGIVHTYLEKAEESDKTQTREHKEHTQLSFDTVYEEFKGKLHSIDVRNLEMPMPMVTILEELEKLEPGKALYVDHKKLPQYLLPELEDRNFKWVTTEIGPGNVKMIIFK